MKVGDFVSWIHTPWGLRRRSRVLNGVIVQIGRRRIQVETTDGYGDLVRYWVAPDKLQPGQPPAVVGGDATK